MEPRINRTESGYEIFAEDGDSVSIKGIEFTVFINYRRDTVSIELPGGFEEREGRWYRLPYFEIASRGIEDDDWDADQQQLFLTQEQLQEAKDYRTEYTMNPPTYDWIEDGENDA